MTLWLVRADEYGEHEENLLKNNIVMIRWDLPDLSEIQTIDHLKTLYLERYGSKEPRYAANIARQIWLFLKVIKKGDLVVLPLRKKPGVSIGKVTGDYKFKKMRSGIKHTRSVKWLGVLPRSAFDTSICLSLRATRIVGQIKIKDAEKRVSDMLKENMIQIDTNSESYVNLEQRLKDEITKFIETKFVGHDLARLIAEIFQAKDGLTEVSPPGPDGGVDIRVSTPIMDLGHHDIYIQVKSSKKPVGAPVVRAFGGAMSRDHVTQGFFVAWGGITGPARKEISEFTFSIRVWDQNNIIKEILKTYEKFSEPMKAELPIKQVWMLVKKNDD